MCGIAGSLGRGACDGDALAADLQGMADAIAHRGPDDSGIWVDAAAGIGFAHRRLSVIDLSPLGHQPMRSESGRYTITFNGEIYNYRELRTELTRLGHSFRGTSDTEVLLAAIEEWGVRQTLVRSVGMFALGLWDRETRMLTLARDRFGEKPLYFGIFRDTLVFASELKAIRKHRGWHADIDRNALNLLMRHGFIPAPHSVFKQCRKIRPGHFASIHVRDGGFDIAEQPYWDPRQEMQDGARAPFPGSARETVDHFESLLSAAVGRQVVADVPVGAFLSGGIDSSLIVALMKRVSSQAVRTFAIGFAEKDLNEAPYAKSVAQHLGTEHTELIVTPRDALAVIPKLPQIYDEPFADVSQIPTFLVSQLARKAVTVSLSGDAGDELFGGYSRYQIADRRWQMLRRIPAAMRGAAGGAIHGLPHSVLQLISTGAQLTKQWQGRPDFGERLRDKSRELRARSAGGFYGEMHSYFHWPAELVLGSEEPATFANSPATWPSGVDSRRLMMYQDTCLYLPDDILVKVDRAAMAVALETRVPMLDPDVARAAWSVPSSVHFADGRGKWILRQILERHIPRSLIDRPKAGFEVPIGRWLRTDLRGWAEALLEPAKLARQGIFDPEIVARRWQQHLVSDATNWSFHIWIILMFQAWFADWEGAVTR